VSFFGLGFPAPTASWGTMLQDAWSGAAISGAPWLLAPGVALFVVVYALHLAGGASAEHALLTGAPRGAATSSRS
jgi:peptide/nickel transport system permease protein